MHRVLVVDDDKVLQESVKQALEFHHFKVDVADNGKQAIGAVYREKYGWTNNNCPHSKYLGDNTLSIPVHPNVTKKEAIYICEKINQFFQK